MLTGVSRAKMDNNQVSLSLRLASEAISNNLKSQILEPESIEAILCDPLLPPIPSIILQPPSDSEDNATTIEFAAADVLPPKPTLRAGCNDPRGDVGFDFIFTQRQRPLRKPKKLAKSNNRLSSRTSSSNMASDAKSSEQRNSPELENTFAKRIGSMLSREGSPKENPKRSLKPGDFIFDKPMSIDEAAMLAVSPHPFAMKDDKLPAHDKQALEGRLNYHLSELNYLKKYIDFHNDNIEQTTHRATMVANRSGLDEEKMVRLMFELSNAQRVLRNVAKPFVAFHRGEIDKIAEIRVQMNIDAGLGPKVPAIFKSLSNDYEWAEMFMI